MAFLDSTRKSETLYSLTTPVSSGASAASYSLSAFSLPANALRRPGQSVRVTAWGTVGTNENTKTIALRLDGTALNASATGTTSNGAWKMEAILTAGTTSALQKAVCDGYAFGAALAPTNSSLTKDATSALVIDIYATNGSASADVTVNGMVIEGLSD
jgi:hypothetical protein